MRRQVATAELVTATAAGFAGLRAVSPVAPPANAASCTTRAKALPDFDGSGGNRPGLVEIRYADT